MLEWFQILGPATCKNPVIIFGGDGEDRIDPDLVEVIWPGYDDGFDNSGYVTTGHFDPLPDVSGLVSYGAFWYSSSVLFSGDSIWLLLIFKW